MKCRHCGAELSEGFCPECGWSPEMEGMESAEFLSQQTAAAASEANPIAGACQVVGYLVMAVVILGSLVWGLYTGISRDGNAALGWGIFLGGSLSGVFGGLFLLGISEIIQLLEKITRQKK